MKVKKFDPYALTPEELRFIVRAFVISLDRGLKIGIKHWNPGESDLRLICAILTIVGFEVVDIKKVDMHGPGDFCLGFIVTTCHFGNNREDEQASQWLTDMFKYIAREISTLTMANVDRITDLVLEKVEMSTPLKPILLPEAGVLMELPVVRLEGAEFPWFVVHTKPGDIAPAVGGPVGLHGPKCGGVLKRVSEGAPKGKHLLVCQKCSVSISIPNFKCTFQELDCDINGDPEIQKYQWRFDEKRQQCGRKGRRNPCR